MASCRSSMLEAWKLYIKKSSLIPTAVTVEQDSIRFYHMIRWSQVRTRLFRSIECFTNDYSIGDDSGAECCLGLRYGHTVVISTGNCAHHSWNFYFSKLRLDNRETLNPRPNGGTSLGSGSKARAEFLASNKKAPGSRFNEPKFQKSSK